MQHRLVAIAIVLLAVVLAIGQASGQIVREEFTIPLDRYVNTSTNLTIHTMQITISNVTYGGAYYPDPANASWPVLVFQYENYGGQQVAGRLHVQFLDNENQVYEKSDVYMGGPIYPGKKTLPQNLEIAIPKGRLLTGLIVIDDWNKNQVLIPIVYPTPTPAPGLVVAPEEIVMNDDLRNLLIIPIILVVVGFVGWFIAKRRLF